MNIDLQGQYGCSSLRNKVNQLSDFELLKILSAKIGGGELPPPPPPISTDPLPSPFPDS